MKLILSISVVLLSFTDSVGEFLYPVATYTDLYHQQKILVLHQTTLTSIQLWSWDPLTHEAVQMLPASFCPVGIALLPASTGFSFIDNGRIRIKEFIKRSARSLDIYDTISNIGLITWHTQVGYFHALDHRYYAIFSITAGDVTRTVCQPQKDCMYPAPVDKRLFYIERTTTGQQQHYAVVEQSLEQPTASLCIDFGDKPTIFLTMLNADQGFVVQHPVSLDRDASLITFFYYHLVRHHDQRVWHARLLFRFSIPTALVTSSSNHSLHESIVPLMPRLVESTIYYVDYLDEQHGVVCSYNSATKTQESYQDLSWQQPFVPVAIDDMLFCGGPLSSDTSAGGPYKYTTGDQAVRFSLPTINIKNSASQ